MSDTHNGHGSDEEVIIAENSPQDWLLITAVVVAAFFLVWNGWHWITSPISAG